MNNKLFKPLNEQIQVVQIKRQKISESERKTLVQNIINEDYVSELVHSVNSASQARNEFLVESLNDEELGIILDEYGFEINESNIDFIRENYYTIKQLPDTMILDESVNSISEKDKILFSLTEMDENDFNTYVNMLNESSLDQILDALNEEETGEKPADEPAKPVEEKPAEIQLTNKQANRAAANINKAAQKDYDREVGQAESRASEKYNAIKNKYSADRDAANKTHSKETDLSHSLQNRKDTYKSIMDKRADIKNRISQLKGNKTFTGRRDLELAKAELQNHRKAYGHNNFFNRIGSTVFHLGKKQLTDEMNANVDKMKNSAAATRDASLTKAGEEYRSGMNQTREELLKVKAAAKDNYDNNLATVTSDNRVVHRGLYNKLKAMEDGTTDAAKARADMKNAEALSKANEVMKERDAEAGKAHTKNYAVPEPEGAPESEVSKHTPYVVSATADGASKYTFDTYTGGLTGGLKKKRGRPSKKNPLGNILYTTSYTK